MKTIVTKYCVLLFLALCISGCRNPFEPPEPEEPEMGYLSLAIEGVSAGRTILPDTPTADDFAVFTLYFFNTDTDTALDPMDRTNENLSSPIHLNAGTYNLQINAYKDTGKSQLAARGNLPGIVINPGIGNSYMVILRPFIDEGDGTFRWDIDFPQDISIASMTISPLNPSTGTAEKTWYFTGGTPSVAKKDSIDLKTGYYRVIFTLSKDATQRIERREILHIYRNTESFFSFAFTEEYVNNISYTVTFSYNDGVNEPGQQTCTHGDPVNDPGEPNRPGYIFLNWYSDDVLTEVYDFATPVTRDITLYAKWQGPLSGTATIEGTYKIGEELNIITSGITGANAPFVYQWKADDNDIGDATDETYVIRGSDAGKVISCVVTHGIITGSVTATGQIVPYTIMFDITELTDNDSVSFAEQDSVIETYGNANDAIIIYYLLTGGHNTDWLIFTFADSAQEIIETPGSSHVSYTVTAADAIDGVITIAAASEHTNLIVLDAPTSVGLTKNGVIYFTAGTNNVAAGNMSYTYTVYKDGTAVDAYTDKPIASGTTVSGLVGEMLAGTGAYTVKVTAHTANAAYTASSIQSAASIAVHIYSVTVTITGANGTDKITVDTTDHTASFVVYVFSGDNFTLTAVPDTDRKVTWSGVVTGTQMTRTINEINTNAAITAAFTAKAAQTITASTYNITTPLIGETIVSTDGTYTANDGGSAGTHIYQWKRSDNDNRTGNVTNLTAIKDYATIGTDFGKYIWLETTPVGSENLTGTAVQGAVLRVGVRLGITVTGGGGGSSAVYGTNVVAGEIIYGQADVAISRYTSTDIVVWSASEGAFSSTTDTSTTYTPPAVPSTGTITLTVTLAAGPGTINNPFLVETIQDLQHIGKPEAGVYANWTRTAHYRQTANIDMSGQTFTAIGSENARFTGSFDGGGYTISNLTITGSTIDSNQGLFGYIGSGGTVKNVGLIDSSITSYGRNIGGIAGYNNNGTVQNCYNTGTVSGNNYIGGVVGYNDNGKVQNCYNTGTVSGSDVFGFIGGVVGYNNSSGGTVQNCYNTGNINGSSHIGGVVGYNNSGGTVQNCYNTGIVTGSNGYIGGVVGNNYSTVENCYTTGSVTGSSPVGGVVGENNSGGRVQNCVALNTSIRATLNSSSIGRVVGSGSSLTNNYAWERMKVTTNGAYTPNKTTTGKDGADLMASTTKTQAVWGNATVNTGANFNFTAPWKWANDKMPHLFDDDLQDWPFYVTDLGTESNPFLVATVEDLQNIGKPEAGTENVYRTLSAYYKQTANIDLTSAGNWTPIGSSSTRFTGSFDGQGYTINGLTITSGSNRGLFSHIGSAGTVKNVGLVGGSLSSVSNSGGIAGYNYGTIQNSYNTGTVSGSSYIGGIAGNNSGTVENCYVTGNVTGSNNNIGGIVGYHTAGRVENCYATGNITGNNYVGGIVGWKDGYSSSSIPMVKNCVALNESVKATSSTSDIGRVVGRVSGVVSSNSLTNNYARESGMTITANNSPVSPTNNADGKHGANAAAADYEGPNSETWWKNTVLFPDTAWNFAANTLPTLKH